MQFRCSKTMSSGDIRKYELLKMVASKISNVEDGPFMDYGEALSS